MEFYDIFGTIYTRGKITLIGQQSESRKPNKKLHEIHIETDNKLAS